MRSFLKGMGNIALHRRINRPASWRDKQYFIEKEISAILGANHFVATYRKEVFNVNNVFPEDKFRKGDEEFFLDSSADKLGFYRLSTQSSFAFHMGNKMDEFIAQVNFDPKNKIEGAAFLNLKLARQTKIPYLVRTTIFNLLRKINKL